MGHRSSPQEGERERESFIKFSKIGEKDDLIVVGIGDASIKSDDKVIGGVMLFLSNSRMTRASPIYWKSKQIESVTAPKMLRLSICQE